MASFWILTILVAGCAFPADLASGMAHPREGEDLSLLNELRELFKKRDTAASGVSAADKIVILAEHNKYRRDVANYHGQPHAANMQKMYWSDKIAAVAQAWTDKCEIKHDDNWQRTKQVGLGVPIGQNLAWNYDDWAKAIKAWHSEVDDYEFGHGSINGKAVGHYTQIVWDKSALVGCGYRKCPSGHMYFCDYTFGNLIGRPPYVKGETCSACEANCEDGLCDCDGMICSNGGTLDLNECKCACSGSFTGETCDICGSDPSYCGKPQPQGFTADYCSKYTNVPQECPQMCGLC